MSETRIKILEGNIASAKRKLPSAFGSDREHLKRQITTWERMLRELRSTSSPLAP